MVTALERLELPYSVHKVIPFSGELEPVATPVEKKVVCFGSYSMRHTAKAQGWSPGVYDLADLDFEKQVEQWGSHMLNHDSMVSAFKDAEVIDQAFIRPTTDCKYFAGKIFTQEEFYDWKRKVVILGHDYGDLTGDTLIQVVPVKEIYAEYRYWIVAGRIVTKSLYKRGDRVVYSPDVDEKIDLFVRARCKEWSPSQAFVIDICEVPPDIFNDGPYSDDASLKIVEINMINAAGFYASDVSKIVVALENLESEQPMNPVLGLQVAGDPTLLPPGWKFNMNGNPT